MINPLVQIWLAERGKTMQQTAESDNPQAMFYLISLLSSEVDKYITPARIASEHITQENEGILN
jgi:hypothetical protein